MSLVARRPSATSDRGGRPAKASSTRTVVQVTSMAGAATASAAPMESSPNTAPYMTEAYSAAGHAGAEEEVDEAEE